MSTKDTDRASQIGLMKKPLKSPMMSLAERDNQSKDFKQTGALVDLYQFLCRRLTCFFVYPTERFFIGSKGTTLYPEPPSNASRKMSSLSFSVTFIS